MAYLPAETSETIWNLLKQLLKIVEDASAAEFALFERYGETDSTLSNLELPEFGLQLEEIQANLEKHLREKKLKRIEKAMQNLPK